MDSMDIINFNEPDIKDKIIKTVHYYLDNDIHGNCMKTKINDGINSFIEFYSNLNINRDKLKDCIYNYISEYYFQGLIRSKCHNYTIDIKKDIQGTLSSCDTYYYHGYGTFNIHYVYQRFLFNELNDSINNTNESLNDNIKSIKDNYKNFNGNIINVNNTLNKQIIDSNDKLKSNYKILNEKIIDNNHMIKNNSDILNEKIIDTNSITNMILINLNNIENRTKILIDNYHILDKSIIDINSNLNIKLKKLNDNYSYMIKMNVILFITIIYNLFFK